MDPKHLLESFGTAGLIAIIFAETGLLIGFFLPGDSLLFTAGLLCSSSGGSKVHLNLAVVLVGVAVAAIAGAQTGYVIGRRAGPALFRRPESRLFKKEYVDRAQEYFDRYGNRTIVLARFIPIVRTFANVVAGVGQMELRDFTVFNIIGGLAWSLGVTVLGYFLGKTVPSIDKYLLPAIAVIVILSALPVIIEVLRQRRTRSR